MTGPSSEIDVSSSMTITPNLEAHQANIDAFVNAAKQGQLDLMQQLYHPDYLNAFNSRKSLNALLSAAQRKHDHVVNWLLAKDQIDLNVKDGYFERTPLNKAFLHGCDDATLLAFINHPNIDLNLRSPLEGSALTLAIYYEEWGIAKAILDKLTVYSDGDHPCA